MYHKLLLQFNRLLNKNALTIVYKLLHDTLLIGLVFFFIILLAESLIPGIVTRHIGFPIVVLGIGTTMLSIYIVASLAGIETGKKSINKKTVFSLLFLLLFIVFNSLWKAGIILNLFLLFLFAISGYFLYKILFEE